MRPSIKATQEIHPKKMVSKRAGRAVTGSTPNTDQWGESLANERETAGRSSGISSVEDA